MNSNLLCGMTESSIPGNSPADQAIDAIISDMCDICISDIPTCPVYQDTSRCPKNITEEARHEYYHGND